MRAFGDLPPLIFQSTSAVSPCRCTLPELAPKLSPSAERATGCRGFVGPVPPPLWMSVQVDCCGRNGSILGSICQKSGDDWVDSGTNQRAVGLGAGLDRSRRGCLIVRAERWAEPPSTTTWDRTVARPRIPYGQGVLTWNVTASGENPRFGLVKELTR